ncbi:MAG: hypothetical protein GYA21_05870 [Myxococcales bacterium]|nr:hypothetical protein [Myxococcales bacterium]
MLRAAAGLALILYCAAITGCEVFLPAVGGEGQSCFDNLTCKQDLMCVDGVCRARFEPDGGDGGDGADDGDAAAGDDGGPGDAGVEPDGDGFIPACAVGETRCQERVLQRCVEPGEWQDDHRCNVGCNAAQNECLKVVDIAAGHSHTCAVISDGRVLCWGNNGEGQLGIGTFGNGTIPPAQVFNLAGAPLAGARRVALSSKNSCALHQDNSVSCWGSNVKGECAISPAGGILFSAQKVSGLVMEELVGGTWVSMGAIAADLHGSYWGCALLGESCWDNQNYYTSPHSIPGLENLRSLCLGGDHACGLVDVNGSTEVRCFGRNAEGQLGNASLNWQSSQTPVKVDNSDGWSGLGCSNGATFAWGPSGAYSWGNNSAGGVLGNASVEDYKQQSPGPLLLRDEFDHPLPVRSIRGGMRHACAEVEAGGGLVSIYCWGYSLHGQVGASVLGEMAKYARPQLVLNLPPVRKLGVGWEHNCVILEDDETVKCWGYNNLGAVNGLSLPENTSLPLPVTFP